MNVGALYKYIILFSLIVIVKAHKSLVNKPFLAPKWIIMILTRHYSVLTECYYSTVICFSFASSGSCHRHRIMLTQTMYCVPARLSCLWLLRHDEIKDIRMISVDSPTMSNQRRLSVISVLMIPTI